MKCAIRKLVIDKRDTHPDPERRAKSSRIMERLFSLKEFKNAKTVAFYVSTKREVRTDEMIEAALAEGKNVVVPITLKEHKKLALGKLTSLDELERGAFGVLEPKKEYTKLVNEKDVDIVIVPGIAFDREGNRIGYGMGYYDKLLAAVRPEIPFIALAFSFQLVECVEEEEHDVAVDLIVTEEEVVKCRK